MITSLQPSRPKTQPTQPLNPLCQQQIRNIYPGTAHTAPRNQIQAMPPHKAPVEIPSSVPAQMYNAATTHPVFFAQSWRKPPFPMPLGAGFSPAATGYVFGDARKRSQSTTKL